MKRIIFLGLVFLTSAYSIQAVNIFEIVKNGSLAGLYLLIYAGEDVNQALAEDDEANDMKAGSTPIFYSAVFNPNSEITRTLLQKGADVNVHDRIGDTLLMKVLKQERTNKSVFSILLDYGADVHARDAEGYTPLMLAVKNHKSPEIVEKLVLSGSNISSRTINGDTAIILAVKETHDPRIITILAKAGADIDSKMTDGSGSTLLFAAIYENKKEMLKSLLNNGADPNVRDNEGVSPLMAAAALSDDPEVLHLLLHYGADHNTRDIEGYSPLMYAALLSENPAVVAKLIESGASVDAKSDDGLSPLWLRLLVCFASEGRHITDTDLEIIKLLIPARAAPYVAEENSYTPYMFTFDYFLENPRSKAADILELFILAGADMNYIADNGFSTLMNLFMLLEFGNTAGKPVELKPGEIGLEKVQEVYEQNENYQARVFELVKLHANSKSFTKKERNAVAPVEYFLGNYANYPKDIREKMIDHLIDLEIIINFEKVPESKFFLMQLIDADELHILPKIHQLGFTINGSYEETQRSAATARANGDTLETDRYLSETPFGIALNQLLSRNEPNLYQILKQLIEMDADVNGVDDTGESVLMLAARWVADPKIITLLLDSGADGSYKNAAGLTAFDRGKNNEALKGTKEYWALNDARFN
jgi:uncharacterized protein